MIRSAILVDGGFYRRRAQFLWGEKCSKDRADELIWYCRKHLFIHGNECELYRIFYYDCPPMSKKMRHPLSGELIDFEKTDLYTWTTEFLNELRKKRKVALRLGTLAEAQAHFNIDPQVTKKLCNSTMQWGDLTKDDFKLDVKQKGVREPGGRFLRLHELIYFSIISQRRFNVLITGRKRSVQSGIYLLVSLKQHAILTSVQMFKNSKGTKGIDI
jgi:hypothetical protein